MTGLGWPVGCWHVLCEAYLGLAMSNYHEGHENQEPLKMIVNRI